MLKRAGSEPSKHRPRGPPRRIFNRTRHNQTAAVLDAKFDMAQRDIYKGTLAFEVEVEVSATTGVRDVYMFQLKLSRTS